MTIITTSEEQVTFNNEECPVCHTHRFQHINAVLCSEPTTTDQYVLLRLSELEAKIDRIATFIDKVEDAIASNPMAQMMFPK